MSAADEIKAKLRDAILGAQAQIIRIQPPQTPPSGEAENSLRSALLSFFNASNPPSGIVMPAGVFGIFGGSGDGGDGGDGDTDSPEVFNYGSGDADDIINIDAKDINTDSFVKTCKPLKGYILLVFPIADLFERCSRYTQMKSRVLDFQTQNQREHLVNLIALTEDEWELFGEDFLHNCAIAVHNLIGAYGRNAGVRSMIFNLGTVANKGTIIYAMEIPEKGFFHNYVLQLYENIASALYYSVLQQWAIWCNDAGEMQANGARYATMVEAITSFRNIGCPRIVRPKRYY
jgi:hypothetical protein